MQTNSELKAELNRARRIATQKENWIATANKKIKKLEEALAAEKKAKEEAQAAVVRLEKLATVDFLSGLDNKGSFEEKSLEVISQSFRSGRPLSLVMMDLDKFKEINDNFGHAMGDVVIAGIGRLMKNFFRAGDIVARWGGDEFAILMPNTTAAAARKSVERLQKQIALETFERGGKTTLINIQASFGIAEERRFSSQRVGKGVSQALKKRIEGRADKALYTSKRAQRHRISLAPRVIRKK